MGLQHHNLDNVPNVPCGVERQKLQILDSGGSGFLMYRVELKDRISRGLVKQPHGFLMYRVELKAVSSSTKVGAGKRFLMYRVELKALETVQDAFHGALFLMYRVELKVGNPERLGVMSHRS